MSASATDEASSSQSQTQSESDEQTFVAGTDEGDSNDGDPDHGGRMLGNMPHVSSHLSLIEALAALDEAEGRRPAPVLHDDPEEDPETADGQDLTRGG